MELATGYLWLNIILFVVGLAVLAKGSDWFVEAAAAIAHHYNVPDIVIGLTLVSIGTSLPEFATNICAAFQGHPEVAMGNVTGSNIANVLLVLGLSVILMKRVEVDRILFNRDTVIMAAAFLVFAVMCYAFPINSAAVGRLEGVILLALFAGYMALLLKRKDEIHAEVQPGADKVKEKHKSPLRALPFVFLGGAMVVFGAKVMVDTVVHTARTLLDHMEPKQAESLIAATVIAFGTSVPELAVTVSGIIKKKSDIALGNIIGSNIFNLVFVMGATATVAPIPINDEIATLILPVMMLSGAVLLILMRTGWALVRWEGWLLVAGYAAFAGINVSRCIRGG